jgi:hypothetical protein
VLRVVAEHTGVRPILRVNSIAPVFWIPKGIFRFQSENAMETEPAASSVAPVYRAVNEKGTARVMPCIVSEPVAGARYVTFIAGLVVNAIGLLRMNVAVGYLVASIMRFSAAFGLPNTRMLVRSIRNDPATTPPSTMRILPSSAVEYPTSDVMCPRTDTCDRKPATDPPPIVHTPSVAVSFWDASTALFATGDETRRLTGARSGVCSTGRSIQPILEA